MIHYDTRKIKAKDTFLAIGKGSDYIDSKLIFTTSKIIKLKKEEVYKYLLNLWGIDIGKIKIIGVTGTNGKTTTTYLVQQILEEYGQKCQILGTINCNLTTPEIFDILALARKMIEKNEKYLIMEVSSIGVVEKRIAGLPFAVKCLTNITRDHLDYHKDFKSYVQSKFGFLKLPGPTIYPKDYKKIKIDFPTLLQGKFNQDNMKAAYAITKILKVPEKVIKKALAKAQPPKGRFEPVSSNAPFQVIVDYAHTPDGLLNILKTARALTKDKLIVVFGAGGNRDKTKRPLMGKAVEDYADTMIVTTDNPRHEDPKIIIKEILTGIKHKKAVVIEDREKAIQTAVSMAEKNDIIIIAGKGHENYQIIGDKKIHFDDFEIAEKYLKAAYP
ncbi:MAG: UDP-N-acetylmuramoyl-L-alanyl-D-glutamate--2,6-diaminopimelate ligase [Candidatus Margulisbacteria bacterium]|nr:UDP-N-acetylmuramoyl-L-alanyl-D-glutamate--2,6-diaminopimelate ligase [Candidatus Margulisiibacteriota bacterium]